jgi:triosephosphate isomerase
MVLFPSALAFQKVEEIVQKTAIDVGAQNIHWIDQGGYTGDISADMYRKAGALYTLIGHSERRHLAHETNHDVRAKIEAALRVGLIPVLCVGEKTEERERGEAVEVVEAQLRAAYEGLAWPSAVPVIIAYEPVWAIGTGLACDASEAERMHGIIFAFTQALLPGTEIAVVYGGSVRPENVESYFREEHVAGVLVGGASVKADSWGAIVGAVRKLF